MTSKWKAVVVGINKYEMYDHLPSLTAPADDANKITEELEKHAYRLFRIKRLPEEYDGEGKSQVSTKGTVHALTLEKELKNLLDPPDNHPPDTALFFFSGHGWLNPVNREVFLATGDFYEANGVVHNGVAISSLGKLIKDSKVNNVIIWLDCCYSGALIDYLDLHDSKDSLNHKNYCIFTATRSYEQAIELKNYKQSLFTQSLLKGLDPNNYPDSDGIVDSHQLAEFIKKDMSNEGQEPLFANSKNPTPLIHEGGSKAPIDKCPYLALEYFSEKKAEFFHGRTKLTNTLVEHIKNQDRFITIFGASGSGKSSLIRAGLLYQLKLGKAISGSNDWIYLEPFPPTNNPFTKFGKIIEKTEKLVSIFREIKKNNHNSEDQEFVEFFQKFKEDKTQIVIIIDQFEECFTMCNKETTKDFINLLTNLTKELPNLYLIIGMRNDFRGRLREFKDFSDAIKAKVNIEPLNRGEIEEAIMKPAQAVRLVVDKDLKEQLIKDVEDYPGSLPLLQYTLTELWRKSREQNSFQLKLETYKNWGGIEGTLNKRATEVYNGLPSKDKKELSKYQNVARRIFLELIQIGDREDTRRRISLGDLVNKHHDLEALDSVTEELARPKNRLITRSDLKKSEDTDQPQTSSPKSSSDKEKDPRAEIMIDVVHEALISHWNLLGAWRQEYKDLMVIERRIEALAQEWEKGGRKKQDLYPASKWGIAKDYLEKFDEKWQMLDGIAEEFIEESRKHKQRVLFYWISGGIVIGAILGLTFAFATYQAVVAQQQTGKARNAEITREKEKAEAAMKEVKTAKDNAVNAQRLARLAQQNQQKAEEEKERANKNETKAQQKTKEAENSRIEAENNLNLAQKNAIEAQNSAAEAKKQKKKAEDNLRLAQNNEQTAKTNAADAARQRKKAEDNLRLAQANEKTAKRNETAALLGEKAAEARLDSDKNPTDALVKIIYLTGESQNTLHTVPPSVYSNFSEILNKPVERNIFTGHQWIVTSVAFSPDGKYIASGSEDNTVRLWDLEGNLVRKPFRGHTNSVNSIAFSPDEPYIISASSDKTLRLWNLQGNFIREFKGHQDVVRSVVFSHDGKSIISGGDDGIRLWDLKGNIVQAFPKIQGQVKAVAFDPDGKTIVVANDMLQFWNREGNSIAEPIQTNVDGVSSFSIGINLDLRFRYDNPKKHMIVTVGRDGILYFIDFENKKKMDKNLLQKHGIQIASVAFSPDSEFIAVADTKILVLTNATGERDSEGRLIQDYDFVGHKYGITSVAFNPVNHFLVVTGSRDKTVRLWDTKPFTEAEKSPSYKDDKNGEALLTEACKRLLFHPVLVETKTDEKSKVEKRKVREICQKIWDLTENAQFLVNQGRKIAQQGNIQEAVAKFKQALRLNPKLNIKPEEEAQRLFSIAQSQKENFNDIISEIIKKIPKISNQATYQHVSLSEFILNNKGNVVIASPGEKINASTNYKYNGSINDTSINQIIVGIQRENMAQACIYNGSSIGSGHKNFTLTAPSEPGIYYIRFRYAQAYGCEQGALGWWRVDNEPTGKANIGAIVVKQKSK